MVDVGCHLDRRLLNIIISAIPMLLLPNLLMAAAEQRTRSNPIPILTISSNSEALAMATTVSQTLLLRTKEAAVGGGAVGRAVRISTRICRRRRCRRCHFTRALAAPHLAGTGMDTKPLVLAKRGRKGAGLKPRRQRASRATRAIMRP